MNTNAEIKNVVREKYTEIATQSKTQNQSSCCGATSCCSDEFYNIMADDYTKLEGYNPDADLGLGCGLPTVFARINEGDTIIDLGSGAGNDAFVARKVVGEKGRVIGVDFTEAMIAKAKENAVKLGYENVEFRQGDIEDLPITSNKADVVVSNCVLNLVPNKHKVFSEIYRVLKPGAHFSISDIVLEGNLSEKWKEIAEMYAGCVAGAIQKNQYLAIIEEAGFKNIIIQKDKTIVIPDDILNKYFSDDEIAQHKESAIRIASITVFAEKPTASPDLCCGPDRTCC